MVLSYSDYSWQSVVRGLARIPDDDGNMHADVGLVMAQSYLNEPGARPSAMHTELNQLERRLPPESISTLLAITFENWLYNDKIVAPGISTEFGQEYGLAVTFARDYPLQFLNVLHAAYVPDSVAQMFKLAKNKGVGFDEFRHDVKQFDTSIAKDKTGKMLLAGEFAQAFQHATQQGILQAYGELPAKIYAHATGQVCDRYLNLLDALTALKQPSG